MAFWNSRKQISCIICSLFVFFSIVACHQPISSRSSIDQSLHPAQQAGSTAKLAEDSSALTDFEIESQLPRIIYRSIDNYAKAASTSGAVDINAKWEAGASNRWYIEEQLAGAYYIIGGILKNDTNAIEAGFKIFDWGFAHQGANGGFSSTGDAFHSTSFFVEALAHALLFIQQSPVADRYADRVNRLKPQVHQAARWMISPQVWDAGIQKNLPYTHRRYLVAAALGLTGKLNNDRELIDKAHVLLRDGLSLQRADGVNPEQGGYDSNYQAVGLTFAQRWTIYFPKDPVTPSLKPMIEKGLQWQKTRILPTGEVNTTGNTRTAGQEKRRNGMVKGVSYQTVIRAFAYWAIATQHEQWQEPAERVAQYVSHHKV